MMSSFDQNHHYYMKGKQSILEQINAQDSNMGPSTSGEMDSRNKRVRREHDVNLASSLTSSTSGRTETHASPSYEHAYPDDAEDIGDGHSAEYERRRLEERREYNRRNAARARLRTKEQISNLIKQVEDLKSKVETTEHQKLELEIQLTDMRKENKRLYELLQQQGQNNLHQNQTPGRTSVNGGFANKPSNISAPGTSSLPSPYAGGDLHSGLPLLHSDTGGEMTTGMNPWLSLSAGAMTEQTVLPGPSSSEARLQQPPLIDNKMASTLSFLFQHNPSIAQGLLTPTQPTTQQPPPLSVPQLSNISTTSTTASVAPTAILAALLAINQGNVAGHGNKGSLH